MDYYYTVQRHDILGVSCPAGYYYSFESKLCHYSSFEPKLDATKPISVQNSVKKKKLVKMAKIDCVKAINYCGFNK